MRNSWLLSILLIILIFSSGCTQGDIYQIIGWNVREEREVELNDILVVESKTSIPMSPVLPGSPVKLTYIIKNKGHRQVCALGQHRYI
ncbi:MAG: hypothetical protein B6U68_01275 [Candidatus Aenigmarchaeota archaeon ex4484_14]|nr:MAG: hypothetical protein B6U68_01275 [Candidatus Aenigmarchaeota archaeon ex4484_14]